MYLTGRSGPLYPLTDKRIDQYSIILILRNLQLEVATLLIPRVPRVNKILICNECLEAEFKDFEPRLKSAKPRFKLSAGLNLETSDTILSGTNHI